MLLHCTQRESQECTLTVYSSLVTFRSSSCICKPISLLWKTKRIRIDTVMLTMCISESKIHFGGRVKSQDFQIFHTHLFQSSPASTFPRPTTTAPEPCRASSQQGWQQRATSVCLVGSGASAPNGVTRQSEKTGPTGVPSPREVS